MSLNHNTQFFFLLLINLINKLKRTRRANFLDDKSIISIQIQIEPMNNLKLHRERERKEIHTKYENQDRSF